MSNLFKKQKGFTLVEIAIVLVIIGILLGGILKGQEIIQNARFKNAINQFHGIVTAAYSYQDRYSFMPGDDANADRFTDVSSSQKGNGNGIIEGSFNGTSAGDESRRFFQHLRAAGLIKGSGTDSSQPKHPWGGIIGIQNNAQNMSGHSICFGDLSGEIAEILDRQNDDGIANRGSVRGSGATGATVNYIATTQYDVCFKF